jgi:hypothetical protein
MNKITFLSSYGDETRTVEIERSNPNVHSCTIFEDHLYQGSVILYNGTDWTVVPQKQDIWTMDDKQAILDRMIEAGVI